MSDTNWLAKLAPALGTALLGPLGGAAAGYIADQLGLEEKTVEAVKEAITGNAMSADQVASLKVAEIEFQKFLKQNNIDLEAIHAKDRDSARGMQIATGSWVPGALAVSVTCGFFGILSWMLAGEPPKSDALLVMLGSLGTAWTAIISFYFGSSQGSRLKTEILGQK